MRQCLSLKFPNIVSEGFEIISPTSRHYNCIAWAAGDNKLWWWPNINVYWPPGLPLDVTIDNFIEAFRCLGYQPCSGTELEPGFEKVAIYVLPNGEPQHMARQLESGKWTSKLGKNVDIEHGTLHALEDSEYGHIAQILKRPR
jgi:hypothetical protein